MVASANFCIRYMYYAFDTLHAMYVSIVHLILLYCIDVPCINFLISIIHKLLPLLCMHMLLLLLHV